MMKIDYNVTGPSRKKLAQVFAKTLGVKAVYLPNPVNGYQIGPYRLTGNGVVEVDETEPTVDDAINAAVAAGFLGTIEGEPDLNEEDPFIGSISITKDGMTSEHIENLKKIIIAKACLMKKAFGTDRLPVLEEFDKITFEWFPDMNPDNGPAYIEFISALRKMAMEAKRVTMKDKEVENDKYAWRCFLLRLGFIGPEYKNTRKTLMKNFTGSSAFKSKKEAVNE